MKQSIIKIFSIIDFTCFFICVKIKINHLDRHDLGYDGAFPLHKIKYLAKEGQRLIKVINVVEVFKSVSQVERDTYLKDKILKLIIRQHKLASKAL